MPLYFFLAALPWVPPPDAGESGARCALFCNDLPPQKKFLPVLARAAKKYPGLYLAWASQAIIATARPAASAFSSAPSCGMMFAGVLGFENHKVF
jgi:hypothetical protein